MQKQFEADMDYDYLKFSVEMEKLNVVLTNDQIDQFIKFYQLLIEKNKVMNLTAITEFEEVMTKHFLDSLSVTAVFQFQQPDLHAIDLGTGAGFPGIPLKIAFPDINFLLVDSLNKRVQFLNEVISELGLKNISTLHARAEDVAKNHIYREQFNLCVSRAVANLSTLSEYCIPFVKKGGYFVSYKSGQIEEEAEQAKKAVLRLGGELERIHKFDLYDQKRSFVVIKKISATPKKYPRKAGIPAKEPLM